MPQRSNDNDFILKSAIRKSVINNKYVKYYSLKIEFISALQCFAALNLSFHNISNEISRWSIIIVYDEMNVFFVCKIAEMFCDWFFRFGRRCHDNECSKNNDLKKYKLTHQSHVYSHIYCEYLHINNYINI